MKRFSLLFAFILFVSLVQAQDIKFDKETIDYGTIAQSSDGEKIFEFTNTGDAPLILIKVISSCGCTVPQWPKQAIIPGEKGKIKVRYNTKKLGRFSKAITILSNAKSGERKVIKIKGIVEEISMQKKKSILSEKNS